MAKDRDFAAYLRELAGQFSEESMAAIDFDEAASVLPAAAARLATLESLAADQALLRDHYERRIAGMVKAIAAVDRKRDRLEWAADLVDQLAAMPAAQLLEAYRRVAVRFRDCFPASYGPRSAISN